MEDDGDMVEEARNPRSCVPSLAAVVIKVIQADQKELSDDQGLAPQACVAHTIECAELCGLAS
jgi:hypothetical protein